MTNINPFVKIIDPIEYNDWNELMLNFSNYSFFHTLEWAKVLSKTYNYKPVYFCLFNNSKLSSVVPVMEIKSKLTGRRLVSLPFSDFCEPLFNSFNDSEILKKLIFDYCKENKLSYIEFRTSDIKFPFETEQFRMDLRHVLNLKLNESELKHNLSDNNKRNIKSVVNEGLLIKEDNSLSSLISFYNLQSITRKKHGLPPQPRSFFNSIFRYIISENKGKIFSAYLNNKPIASQIFFTFGEKVLYKFGASINHNLPKGTNHLLMWEAIKKFSEEGYKELDLGRTETNHVGLRRFKLGFGAEERIIYTTRYNFQTNSFESFNSKTNGFYNHIFKHTPLYILKMIGNTLYKHIG